MAGATVLASHTGLLTDTASFILQAQQALPSPTSPQAPGGYRDSYRVRGESVKQTTSVPPPGRSLIVWKMANGTTMPAARSSMLGVSTHSTAGRCRQETHKSPSTRWNHALVTWRREGARAISIAGVCPPETRGLRRPPTQDDGLHKAAFVLQGKASFPLHLEEISQGGLARSHTSLSRTKEHTSSLQQGKDGCRNVMSSTQPRCTLSPGKKGL